jgi:hypothetical protein
MFGGVQRCRGPFSAQMPRSVEGRSLGIIELGEIQREIGTQSVEVKMFKNKELINFADERALLNLRLDQRPTGLWTSRLDVTPQEGTARSGPVALAECESPSGQLGGASALHIRGG